MFCFHGLVLYCESHVLTSAHWNTLYEWSGLRMRRGWLGFNSRSVHWDCLILLLMYRGNKNIVFRFLDKLWGLPAGGSGLDWLPARQPCTYTLFPAWLCNSHILLPNVASGSPGNFTCKQVRMWQANCRRMHNLTDWISGKQTWIRAFFFKADF